MKAEEIKKYYNLKHCILITIAIGDFAILSKKRDEERSILIS